MTRTWWLVAAIAVGSCGAPSSSAVAPTPEPVTEAAAFDPPAPTLRLPRHFLPIRYNARLAVDPAKPTFDGEIAIDGILDRPSAVIWLHATELEVASATASNGTATVALVATPHGELLELRAAQPLAAHTWTLHLTYRGKLVQNGYQGAFVSKQGDDRYVTTQFESTAARMVFPCFDEPDVKVPWQLTMDVPSDQLVVSNTPIMSQTDLDAGHHRVTFAPTRPLPSYLIAFGVGPYEVVDAGKAKSGLPLHVYAPRGKTKEAAYLVGALPRIVDILEAWFAIPYPYPKLDIVVVPSARGLFMENAGMITADARGTLVSKPSPIDEYKLVSVIGHETAHQWFGDLVTAAWWDDIWLNESFATWIEDKILAGFDPSWPSEVVQHRQAAFDADELASSRKIHQPIDTLDSIHNIFDDITYPKGATVLRMLEHEVGEAAFQAAIRSYLNAHADRNAKAADVFAAIDKAAGKPLGELVTSYFDQAGVPDVTMQLSCGDKPVVELAQTRYSPIANATPSTQRWIVPVCVAYEGAKHERLEACTQLADATGELALDRCPAWFAPAGDYGYYRANLEPKALEAIRDKAWPMLTSAERIAIYSHAWAHARSGSPAIALIAGLGDKLRADSNPLAVAVALGDTWANGAGVNAGLPPGLAGKLPPELVPVARARVRAVVEPMIRRLGLAPRADDTFGVQLTRICAVSAFAWARSTLVDGQAVRLAAAFRELPLASRTNIAAIAVNADVGLADNLRGQLATEPDRANRDVIVRALGSIHDPKRRLAAVEAVDAAPTTNAEDLIELFNSGGHDAVVANADYIRSHLDGLLQRMPSSVDDDFPIAIALLFPLFTCDAAKRDDAAAYVHEHFGKLSGATLVIKQAIEGNDHCIAEKQLLEPGVRAWLTGK